MSIQIKDTVIGKISTSDNATNDSSGNKITDTYVKYSSGSGYQTVFSTSDTPLRLLNSSSSGSTYLGFFNGNSAFLGSLGVTSGKVLSFYNGTSNTVLHSGNFSTWASPVGHTHSGYMAHGTSSIEMNSGGSLANYGGFIDFHYHNGDKQPTDAAGTVVQSTPDYTSRIIEDSPGRISINGAQFTRGSDGTHVAATYFDGTADYAAALTVKSKGSATNPIYWDANGQPVACTYTLGQSVTSSSKLTDTTYTIATGDSNGQIKVTPSSGSAYNVAVKGLAALAYKASLSASDLTQGYLNNHPENGPTVLPFIYNDLAFLTKRGGSCKIYKTTSTDFTAAALSETTVSVSGPDNLFDGSPSYATISTTGEYTAVIDMTLHKTFTYSNVFYIDFGATGWRAKNISVYVMNSTKESKYVLKQSVTSLAKGNWYSSVSHSVTVSGTTTQGFDRLRVVLSGFNSPDSSSGKRIAQIGLINYGSAGLTETYISRGGCSGIFGSLIPHTTNAIDLGSDSKKFKAVYATTLYGNLAWGSITGKPTEFTPASHTHSYLPLSGGTLTGTTNISRNDAGVDTMLYAKRTDLDYNIGFGIGTSNNRGIYDAKAGGWLLKIDTDNVVWFNGRASHDVDGNAIKSTYFKASGGTISGPTTFGSTTKFNGSSTFDSALTIDSEGWGNQLTINRKNNGSNWGPSIKYMIGTTTTGYLCMPSAGKLMVSPDGSTQKFVSFEGHTHNYASSDHTHPIFDTNISGFVPGPSSADTTLFLRADGQWAEPPKQTTSGETVTDNDTKNTTGTTEKASTKLFLAGATSQAANPVTYSNSKCYVGTDNCLYSNNVKVSTDGHTHSYAGTTHTHGLADLTDYRSADWLMTAATSSTAGTAGLVPAPAAGNQSKFLRGDGTWQTAATSNTVPSGYCTTAAGTAAKTASFTYYALTANRYFQVNFRYANSAKSALTLNVNSTGAKTIYINGAASSSSNYTLPAGPYIAYYNGTNYYINTDGTIPNVSHTGHSHNLSALNNDAGFITAASIPTIPNLSCTTGSAESGKYISAISVSGHTITATKASLPSYSAGTGLSLSGTTFNHSNSVTAVTTAGLYKVKYDAQGHITGTTAVAKADITGLGIPGSNTDTKVNVTLATTSKAYLLGVTTAPESTAAALTAVSDTGVYLTAEAGGVQATKMYATSGFFEATYSSSDERLKIFSDDIEVDFDKLAKLRKKYFTWKDKDDQQQLGVSAQEVKEIYPELVTENVETGYLSVDYAKLSVVALAAVDKLVDKQKELEDRLAKIEAALNL